MNIPAGVLTYGQMTSLEQKLYLLMGETYNINITDIKANPMTTEAEVIFYVTDKVNIISYFKIMVILAKNC